MLKKIILLFVTFFICLTAKDNDLQKKISSILRSLPKDTRFGILIYNPNTKDTLYKENICEKLKPASNIKLFTTAAAFSLIGSDSSISTKIFTDSHTIKDGIVNGNLYIKGFGYSLFSDHDIDSLVSVISSLGIRSIAGKIIGDETFFDSEYKRSDWIIDESDFNPLPPISALSINKNEIQFNLQASSKNGGPVSYSIYPECSLILIKNPATTTRSKSSIRISQNFDNNRYEFIISGNMKRKAYRSYSVEINNPPLFTAILLKDRLLKAGIEVQGNAETGETPIDVSELCKSFCTLKYLCGRANKRSDNFIAECLFKTIGAFYSEKQGNGFYGTQAVFSFLKENKIYADDIMIVDGSGLSHQNQVSVLTIVNLLERIYKNNSFYFDYYNSLSIAGKDGTLRNRFIGSNAHNNFHGKTGSLHGVFALSGYIKSATGDDLIVSMLFEYKHSSEKRIKNTGERIVELL
jgi:serine-type D-Ala-D-Ala carboxypeptidase/endopeptidase (penicillin-binding protein 4)